MLIELLNHRADINSEFRVQVPPRIGCYPPPGIACGRCMGCKHCGYAYIKIIDVARCHPDVKRVAKVYRSILRAKGYQPW